MNNLSYDEEGKEEEEEEEDVLLIGSCYARTTLGWCGWSQSKETNTSLSVEGKASRVKKAVHKREKNRRSDAIQVKESKIEREALSPNRVFDISLHYQFSFD